MTSEPGSVDMELTKYTDAPFATGPYYDTNQPADTSHERSTMTTTTTTTTIENVANCDALEYKATRRRASRSPP